MPLEVSLHMLGVLDCEMIIKTKRCVIDVKRPEQGVTAIKNVTSETQPSDKYEPDKPPLRPKYLIVNGELTEFEKATIHLMSPAVRYGLNVFEGLRGYWNGSDGVMNVFRLDDHMRRLWQSMRILRFDPKFTSTEVTSSLVKLLEVGGIRENCHIRVSAFIEGEGDHSATGPVSYFINSNPLPRSSATTSGIRCTISSWARMADSSMPPRAKTGANYVNARLARLQAKQDGYDDALLLNEVGKISEGPGAAVFVVRNGKLITPDITSGILESITRDTVVFLARERGLAVEERPVDRTELSIADEIFLAGTAAEILPVVDVDGLKVGDGRMGKITASLQKAYDDLVTGKTRGDRNWVTHVTVQAS
jgi:branched-chain amino acid aminotransferase